MPIGDVVVLIAALSAAVVSIIDAVRVNKKLDVIHKDTNGNLSSVKKELIDMYEAVASSSENLSSVKQELMDVKNEFRRQRGAE